MIIVHGKTSRLDIMQIIWPTISFKQGIKESLSLIAKCDDSLAIMCSEAVPWRCHRRLIADYLVMIEYISVYNIIGNSGTSQPS